MASTTQKFPLIKALVIADACIVIGIVAAFYLPRQAKVPEYAGSSSCRECHPQFYQKWEHSHHGKAMQPVTEAFVQQNLTALTEPLVVSNSLTYTVDLARRVLTEQDHTQTVSYPILHALGGKNVFYFLTQLEKGKLQTLPLGYNVAQKKWFHTTHSMVRHFLDVNDTPLDWRDPMLTFNTSCFGCHVSQLEKNYDPKTDSYTTRWREPGISCESCHGPCTEHVRYYKKNPTATGSTNLLLTSWRSFTPEQDIHACAPCHAKMRPISERFIPGENYFNHYDLTCLEHADFSADGRDLGENYTYTLWLLNPCAQKSNMDCSFCHTSSGRYRFDVSVTNQPNAACVSCHTDKRDTLAAHSHHAPQHTNAPSLCISCHAPLTSFAAMRRSDHSFRPPCPEASARFGSTSACILCHTRKTETWAADIVRAWHPDASRRKRYMTEAQWIAEARTNTWAQLEAITNALASPSVNPVLATTLLRLMQANPQPAMHAAARRCADHPHPLVRSAAMTLLASDLATRESQVVLVRGLLDPIRLVRLQAIQALAQLPEQQLDAQTRQQITRVEGELFSAFSARPDDWSSAYNRGLYLMNKGSLPEALNAYQTAIRLRPDVILPHVNAAIVLSQQQRLPEAINHLEHAYALAPSNGAVNINLGLAYAENNQTQRAEKHLRIALSDPQTRGQAAYNCAILTAPRNLTEALSLLDIALETSPSNIRYREAKQYYETQKNNTIR